MDPDLLIPIAGMTSGVVTVVAVAHTIRHWVNKHYEHKRRLSAGGDTDRMTEVEERMAAMAEDLAGRMLDLEERVDFTERVLAQGRDRGLLEQGKQ